MKASESAVAKKSGGTSLKGRTSRRTQAFSWRLALIGMVAVIGLTGCGSSTTAPTASGQSAQPATAIPTATQTVSPSPTPAPIPQFVATGSMHTARMDATATLLKNGRVLIAGGSNTVGSHGLIFASAELYDPATGKFTTTGSMSIRRTDHTATLLKDGRVLIAGGYTCSSSAACSSGPFQEVASAEIYNPKTGKFSPTGSMTAPRAYGTATLLLDGKVLMAQGDRTAWAELYDPTSGRFVRTSKQLDFVQATTTLLPDGRVLLAGQAIRATTAAIYDEASGKFTDISAKIAPCATSVATYQGYAVERIGPIAAAVLKDGRVLLFDTGYLETYDPTSGACTDAGFISPNAQWEGPTATLLKDGRVLFAGGAFESDVAMEQITAAAVLYDPVSGSHVAIPLLAARLAHTATLLANGSVLIAGGINENDDGKPLASAELLKP
jgi:hypothetical protein